MKEKEKIKRIRRLQKRVVRAEISAITQLNKLPHNERKRED